MTGFGKDFDAPGHPVTRSHEVDDRLHWTRLDMPLEGGDICASTESTPHPGDDDSAHGRVQLDAIEGADNGRQHLITERIQFVWPIERQPRHRALDPHNQYIAHSEAST